MPISKVFETVRKCREENEQLDKQTMAYVEYWLAWCIEHNDSSLKDDATAFSLQYSA